MKFTPILLAAMLSLGSSVSAFAQNLLVNGDFETPPFDNVGTVTGWIVGGNVADRSDEGFTTPSHSAGFSVGANSQGDSLSQTFATLSGMVYTLDFDANIFGMTDGTPQQLQIVVSGTGTVLDETVTPPSNNNFTIGPFQHYTFTFTADSANTTLTFTDIGLGNMSADTILDTVSVVIPEPSTTAMLLCGGIFAACCLFRARRKASVYSAPAK